MVVSKRYSVMEIIIVYTRYLATRYLAILATTGVGTEFRPCYLISLLAIATVLN